MKKEKGFTLVELIAVIVLLAIIITITMTFISKTIKKQKLETYKDSALGIVKSAELYVVDLNEADMTDNNYVFDYQDGNLKFNDDSIKTTKKLDTTNGSIKVDASGSGIGYFYIDNKYCAIIDKSEEITLGEVPREECNFPYQEEILNGTDPVLVKGMVPIYFDGNVAKKANKINKWYDYESQQWANAIIVKSDKRDYYKSSPAGTEINNDDVLGYFVWIPRYRYSIGSGTGIQEATIEFENNKIEYSTGTGYDGDEFTPYGFKDNNGIWISKFEMTGTETNPTSIPGVRALTGKNVKDLFFIAQIFNSNDYGMDTTKENAHMIKNTEWALVAYLTRSKYGKYGNTLYIGDNKDVYQNKSIFTGNSNGMIASSTENTQCAYNDITDRGSGTGACGAGASTTGNITGVYDMSGGAFEYVMSYLEQYSLKGANEGGQFTGFDFIPSYIYSDSYSTTNIDTACNSDKKCVGQALEPGGGTFVTQYFPWLVRGGNYDSINTNIFSYGRYTGQDHAMYGTRIVIINRNTANYAMPEF